MQAMPHAFVRAGRVEREEEAVAAEQRKQEAVKSREQRRSEKVDVESPKRKERERRRGKRI